MDKIVSDLTQEINDAIDNTIQEINNLIKKNPELKKALMKIQKSIKSKKIK